MATKLEKAVTRVSNEIVRDTGKFHFMAPSRGRKGHPTYLRWQQMNQRCKNPKNKNYSQYGGRGIEVCQEWASFIEFYRYVGDPPFKGAHLDRIDNNDGYKPGNVRWVTRNENAKNTRSVFGSKSGRIGIQQKGFRFRACMSIKGKSKYIGTYDTIEEAVEARKIAIAKARGTD